MDYIGRTMNICLILFMIFITGNHCQYYNNRDIILTPNQLKTYPGKVLYYRPREQVPSEGKPNTTGDSSSGSAAVPWEEVLKETVFLTLNDNKTSLQQVSSGSTENAPTLAIRQQKAIHSAPYIGVIDLTVPRFGDIVELAHGRLEREGDDAYFFVQQDGKQQDDQDDAARRNVSALWKVERIRHRDEQRGHRFELKITVATNATTQEGDQQQQEPRAIEPSNNRTYIIRDEDYPKYFAPINAISPNAIPMHRKNDQAFDRTFFDLLQPQGGPHQFAPFAPATRFYRPAVVAPQQQQQQTITLGQYLVQSLLSGGEAPKFHHHHHHYGKLPAASGFFGATSNRIKFPDSFTGSSHSVPKFYQHIHFQRPSIAPLAPTALPGSYLFHHPKDSHAPAPSNIHQDFAKLASTASTRDPVPVTKPTKANTVGQKAQSTTPNHIPQPQTSTKTSPKPQQFPTQHHQQQFHQQIATTSAGIGPQLTVAPSQNSPPQQFPPQPQYQAQQQPHPIYRPQVPPQQLQPILIHPHAHPQVAGPPGFFPPSHLIQSIPFYNPQGQMVVNHIPVMSNHHMIQMSPPQPIAIPVHLQLIPPVGPPQGHLFAAPPQQQGLQQQQQQQQQQGLQGQQQQQQQGQQQLHPHQPDGLQAIPVRIMQPIPNPVHLYSPINPFLPPLQAQQYPFHHHHHHHQHHPIVTVTPKTTSSSSSPSTSSPSSSSATSPSSSSSVTINYQHHQRHPHPSNHSTVTPTAGHHLTQTSPQSQNHPHTHPHPHPHPHSHPHPHAHSHPQAHSFNVIPTVFKFTSSNAIPHPQKPTAVSGGTAGAAGGGTGGSAPLSTPTASAHHHHHHHHRFQTPNVQLSGPSISPAPAHRNRGNGKQSPAPSSTAAAGSASPTSATRPSARYTPAVGQVSGPTVSSTAANHRYAPLPTVPASPAGLREKFTAPAFQPAASESKQTSRKLEPPTASAGGGAADAVGSPSNAVSPKYESFGVENAVTPTPPSESLLLSATSPATVSSSLSQSNHFASPTASSPSAARTTLAGGSAFSYTNFVDVSGAVSATAKLTASAEQTASSPAHPPRSSSSSSSSSFVGSPSPTAPVSVTTQATYVPPPKSYIQQLGPTIGVKYPPAFKSMPSVTIIPPQIETPISSTLKTYQYLNHHDTYDFIPSRVVELAHVKKMNGQKHAKRTKAQKGQKMPQKPNGAGGAPPPPPAAGALGPVGPNGNHHHHVTVTSNKPLRFYPGDGPEYATHRPEAQLSVQLPPPEKDYAMTYYGTPKHNQKVQRPKNFVTPLHAYGGSSTTPIPAVAVAVSPASLAASPSSSSFVSSPASPTTVGPSPQQTTGQGKNATTSTFRSATASSTAHYYKNRNEKSDDLTTMSITTMRPRVMLKTIYRQFPGSFVSTSTSTSTEKPVQKWVPKRPRSSTKSTSGEFSTSTLPSASHPVSIEQAVASSERAVDVVTKNPIVVTVRSNLDQQMQRVRASRGRSRYTYRRIPSGNPPPIPTGQQATTAHSQSMRTSRMRHSNFSTTTSTSSTSTSTSTTTTKPIIPSATSSVFDSNRIDGRSFEQQERKAEEAVMTAATKNESNEKIKRDIGEVSEEKGRETTVAAAAEELVAQQAENQQDPLEVTEPEKEYVMVKAIISEPIATNHSNMVMFEASDAVASSAGEQRGRSIGSAFDDLTMSIINHAKAIVNQTEKPAQVTALEEVLATASATKSIESNEIAHKDEPEPETTVEVTTTTVASTSSPVTESTVSETIGTTTNDDAVGGAEDGSVDDSVDASQTTVAVESA